MTEDPDRLRILKRFEDDIAEAKRYYEQRNHRIFADFNRRMQELEIGLTWRKMVVLRTIENGCKVELEWIHDVGFELTVGAAHFSDSRYGKKNLAFKRFKCLLEQMVEDELLEKVTLSDEPYLECEAYKVTDYGRRFIKGANNNDPT